jgi:hypothetical protein
MDRKDDRPEVAAEPGVLRRRARRLWRPIVAVVAAFGLLGAVGGKLVDDYYDDVAEAVRGDGPLLVAAGFDSGVYSDGWAAVVPGPPGFARAGEDVTDCASLLEAARGAGAADVGSTWLSVLMEGRTHKDVAITGMRATVLRRGAPLTDTHVSCPSAGDASAVGIAFDLDEERPVARILQDDGSAGDPYFGSSVVTFTEGEVVPFQIAGATSRSYVEWVVEVDLLVDDRRETVRIDDGGAPFRTTAGRPAGDYRSFVQWAWYEDPPRLVVGDEPPA